MNMMHFLLKTAAFVSLNAVMATSSMAQSSVTMYGMVDAGLEMNNSGKGSHYRMISGGTGSSRLGFRGSETLSSDLSVSFHLETGVLLTTGALTQGGRPFRRGASLALNSKKYGSFSMGLINLPYFQVQSKIDAFDWRGAGGLLAAVRDDGNAVVRVLPIATMARVDNALAYVSPNLAGLQLRLLATLSKDKGEYGDAYSGSARFTRDNWDVMAGYAEIKSAEKHNGEVKSHVVGGSYNWSGVKVFLGYTRERNDCHTCTGSLKPSTNLMAGGSNDFSVSNLGVRIPQGNFTWIAQYAHIKDRSNYSSATGKRASDWIGIGMEYALSKRTLVYGSVASISNKNGSNFTLGSGTSTQSAGISGANDRRSNTTVLGIRHTF